MCYLKLCEDRSDLFALKMSKCAEPLSLRSSRLRCRQTKRLEVQNKVRKTALALNGRYEDKAGYERALINSNIASSERSKILAVQDRVVR